MNKENKIAKNVLWNTAGSLFYLACQWLLSVVVVRVSDYSDAGILSLAMSVTNIFATVALFNVRNFQVSDTVGEYTSGEYVTHRHITCLLAMLMCILFVVINGYDFLIAASIVLYMLVKVVEAYADVLHGVAQNKWRLDIAGRSYIIRGILLISSFTLTHIFTKNIALSIGAMSVTTLLALIAYDFPAISRIEKVKLSADRSKLVRLSLKCLPMLVYGICTNSIVSCARYLIEAIHGKEVLGYYASVSTVAVLVQTFVTLIFTPLIGVFTEAYRKNDKKGIAALLVKMILLSVAVYLFKKNVPKKSETDAEESERISSMTEANNHTFTVCAYKESSYLEECVVSLLNQTVKSRIIICTSTPNDHIYGIAEKYGLEVFINEGEAGITGDWNFAYSKCETDYITIAHQDDVYDPTYLEEIISKLEKSKNPIIAFTEYFEVRNGERVYKNKLLRIKRLLNFGFRIFKKSKFVRRRILSLGCSICCPAVSFSREGCRDFKFDGNFRFTCDWDGWERLSKRKGEFLYIKKPLMGHRIHEESTTTAMTEGGERAKEEFIMFRRFWPTWVAKLICKPYAKAAESNSNENK